MNIIELAKEAGFDVDEGLFPFEATEDKFIGTERHLERFAALVRSEALAEPVKQEPEYWEVRNGVCKHGVYRTKEQAEEVRFDMQKSHDLSGSLASFNVRPLYAAPVDAKAIRAEALEEAAKVCEEVAKHYITNHKEQEQVWLLAATSDCAAAIRARGETK